MSESTSNNVLLDLLAKNQKTVTYFYRLATFTLVLALLVHLAFASWYLLAAEEIDENRVWLFVVFNATALLVEVLLSRIAFMLGARAGQLVDTRYALEIAGSAIDTAKLELAAKVVMSMRRDAAGLKVLDIEAVLSHLPKK